jgi:hypothetical protein
MPQYTPKGGSDGETISRGIHHDSRQNLKKDFRIAQSVK